MARRRSRSSRTPSSFGKLVLAIVLLLAGAAAGYAWRSFAPLPLPKPLGGDDAYADVNPLPSNPTPRPTNTSTNESAEIARLRAEIDRLRQAQSQTAQDIAEMQIKSVLGEE